MKEPRRKQYEHYSAKDLSPEPRLSLPATPFSQLYKDDRFLADLFEIPFFRTREKYCARRDVSDEE